MTWQVHKATDDNGDELDEDAAWPADEWCWLVMDGDDEDADVICICATEEEANRIVGLLNMHSNGATANN